MPKIESKILQLIDYWKRLIRAEVEKNSLLGQGVLRISELIFSLKEKEREEKKPELNRAVIVFKSPLVGLG